MAVQMTKDNVRSLIGASSASPTGSASSRRASTPSPTPPRTTSSSTSIPERAAATPFGTTIAHGFLTLSLLPHLMEDSVAAWRTR